ncbi:pilus assembly protein PilM [Candidatus Saccharibacteria bacterium]|nr:pilus assembly protein PilM [Candidatus Saccharibacteria bacterium]
MKLVKGVGDFFALDIGTVSVRAVQLGGDDKKGWSLQGYGYATVESHLTQSDSEDSKHRLGEVINTILGQSGIKTRDVAVNLPAGKTYTTVIDVPNQSPAELQSTIQYQLDQYIPMAVEDAKIDWHVLGPSPKDANMQEVLIASTNKEYAEERMEFIESLGLNVIASEPDPIAMARALNPVGIGDARLIVDFGEESADLVVTYGDAPRLVRSLPGGLHSLVRTAAQTLTVKDDQARQFIIKFGLAQDKLEGMVPKALTSTLDNFAAELVKSVKFFQTKYPAITVGGIILSGFAGSIPYMSEYIEAKTSINTVQGNPWQRVNVPSQYQDKLQPIASEFAVAVGLAERSNRD